MRTSLVLVAALGFCANQAQAQQKQPGAVDYVRDIAPMLDLNCVRCHGETKRSGSLRLDSLAGMLQGGKSGAALVPGKSANSLMVRKSDKDDPTPHKGTVLTKSETALLKAWIDQGAKAPVQIDLNQLPPELVREILEQMKK